MNGFTKAMCFIGGANLDILQKCSTEKNGFIATGISIINVVIVSTVAMVLTIYSVLHQNILLSVLIAIFYGFIVFIGYWGVLSVIRKTAKYTIYIKVFSFLATTIIALVSANAIEKYILGNVGIVSVILLSIIIYIIPIIIKMLINSSIYEEEKEKMERNFFTQKEADIVAYREKYQDYALVFNDANIKMESIKHLGEISKEYHNLLENTQKETFAFLDKLTKLNENNNALLDECKNHVEEQFKVTLGKMSKVFTSI